MLVNLIFAIAIIGTTIGMVAFIYVMAEIPKTKGPSYLIKKSREGIDGQKPSDPSKNSLEEVCELFLGKKL